MKMKTVMVVNKDKPRNEIIYDIVSEAKLNGYKKDTMARRLKGIKTLENEEQFYFMVRKIVKDELPEIREIIFCKTDRFEKYIEMC